MAVPNAPLEGNITFKIAFNAKKFKRPISEAVPFPMETQSEKITKNKHKRSNQPIGHDA